MDIIGQMAQRKTIEESKVASVHVLVFASPSKNKSVHSLSIKRPYSVEDLSPIECSESALKFSKSKSGLPRALM